MTCDMIGMRGSLCGNWAAYHLEIVWRPGEPDESRQSRDVCGIDVGGALRLLLPAGVMVDDPGHKVQVTISRNPYVR